ncbi:Curli production assembly/transport component CsgG [Subsaxibacter sp. CAU 1640]|uniref:Curli production assembly/transport component CsgG n=1 Tax=Subsaxibacter sp. CAU 1640 TaxID=2933271 RepID=UPI002006D7D4|nr:Curli production assembly/transport component CsgG [Subsaxibacter sp. CAU 1640]MCK7591393.1 Curli production assembly/transport component CsgG [Subsaxibacter sp. CAU 1640]
MVFIIFFHFDLSAQKATNYTRKKKIEFYELRGTNAFDAGAGTSILNGDLVDPIFEIYFHLGYKRYLFPHLNLNVSYNKFNLAYKDVYNEGFMSFDANLESTLMPHHRFSPFVFAGAGYNAANYFEQTAMKIQGGGGIEYMLVEGFGLKLYTDYNYVLSDELDGLIAGASDDTYFRIGFGFNYYFGGEKKKNRILKDQPSIINSNQILLDN